MNKIVTTLLGTDIVQYELTAKHALAIGLLTADPRCNWFAKWATQVPDDAVFLYTFGGFIGGFTYRECADFHTLQEFAQCAADAADKVWHEYCNME
jgi:hypothetical protein